jgi:hypothetical protein
MGLRAGFLLFIFAYLGFFSLFVLIYGFDGDNRAIPLVTDNGVGFIDSNGALTTVKSECSSGIRVFKSGDEIVLMIADDPICVGETNE